MTALEQTPVEALLMAIGQGFFQGKQALAFIAMLVDQTTILMGKLPVPVTVWPQPVAVGVKVAPILGPV